MKLDAPQVRVRKKQSGLRVMWFESWYPRDDNNVVVILEDDMELR
jgi:hypothetical protein